jgi:hypothetical protein
MVKAGEIGSVRVGVRPYFRIPESALERFVAEQTKTQRLDSEQL